MVAVQERLTRINKLRKLLGMKYNRKLELQINNLLMQNIAAIRETMNTEGFEVLRDVLTRTAESSDRFLIANVLSPDKELLAYHKAIREVSLKQLEVYDATKLREAHNEMSNRNDRLKQTEEVQSESDDPHFLNIIEGLENVRRNSARSD